MSVQSLPRKYSETFCERDGWKGREGRKKGKEKRGRLGGRGERKKVFIQNSHTDSGMISETAYHRAS